MAGRISKTAILSIFLTIVVSSCSLDSNNCDRVYSDFDGHYSGTAFALPNGDLHIALTENCSIEVDGELDFHWKVAEIWEDADFGSEIYRAVNVDLRGRIVDSRPGGEFQYKVLELVGKQSVRPETSRVSAEKQLHDLIRRSLDDIRENPQP